MNELSLETFKPCKGEVEDKTPVRFVESSAFQAFNCRHERSSTEQIFTGIKPVTTIYQELLCLRSAPKIVGCKTLRMLNEIDIVIDIGNTVLPRLPPSIRRISFMAPKFDEALINNSITPLEN